MSPQGLPVPAPISAAIDPKAAAPGGSAAVGLSVTAPAQAGEYLLLLDVVTPDHGALSTLGSTPSIVRVSVTGRHRRAGRIAVPGRAGSHDAVTPLPGPASANICHGGD